MAPEAKELQAQTATREARPTAFQLAATHLPLRVTDLQWGQLRLLRLATQLLAALPNAA